MKKKICMLLHEFYPNDIRVNKETSSLLASGFEIHLICLKRKNEPSEETFNGIHVHRIPIAQTFFWRGIWDVLLVLFRFHQPVFSKRLKKLHQEEKFDAVHVHDLPLSKTAIVLKKSFPAVKVILDFHENYPEALKVWFKWKTNPLIRLKNKVFFNYKTWLKYERLSVKAADHVIVVVEEMKDRLCQIHEVEKQKVSSITNSESVNFLDQKEIENIYKKSKEDFILAYTGNVGPHRGVDVMVKAIGQLKHLPNVKLIITGKLSTDTELWLNQLIRNDGIENQVEILGYQPFEKFFSYMAQADVNLIPHNRNGHTDNTIPHKLYQGMLVGKPVLVSDAPPLKRVVEKLESGLVFEAGNEKDAAKKIEQLYTDKTLYDQLGKSGRINTIQNEYNWEAEGKKLANLYTQLLAE